MIYTQEQTYRIADSIWQRLGGQHFSLTTGTTPECYGEKDGKVFLLMSVKDSRDGVNLFEVSRGQSEVYDVRFVKNVHGIAKVVASHKNVFPDKLQGLFRVMV